MLKKPGEIVTKLLEADDLPPEHYVKGVPPVFDAEEVLDRLRNDLSAELSHPAQKQEFISWLKANEDLFPDVAKAQEVAARNDYWDTENDVDMEAFFEAIDLPQTSNYCTRCDGSGDEPGAPYDTDAEGNLLRARCSRCDGSGNRFTHCKCDNTHKDNDTVCRWCWARGRRHWNDPAP